MKIDLEHAPPTATEIANERARLEGQKTVLVSRRRRVVVVLCGCAAILIVGPLATVAMNWTVGAVGVIWGVLAVIVAWTVSLIVADVYDEKINATLADLAALRELGHQDRPLVDRYAAALDHPTVASYNQKVFASGRMAVITEVDHAIAWAERSKEREEVSRTLQRLGMAVDTERQTC